MRYKWWFLGSLTAVTVFAIIAVFVVGLDLGIDFQGGRRMQFALEKQATVDDIRVAGLGRGRYRSRSCSRWEPPGTGSAFMVTAEEMTDAQVDELKSTLDARYGLDEQSTAVEQVGASFGRETANKAFIAVAIAIVLISRATCRSASSSSSPSRRSLP